MNFDALHTLEIAAQNKKKKILFAHTFTFEENGYILARKAILSKMCLSALSRGYNFRKLRNVICAISRLDPTTQRKMQLGTLINP